MSCSARGANSARRMVPLHNTGAITVVIKEGTAIRDLYADYVEAGSVYEFLAHAYEAKNENPKAIDPGVPGMRPMRCAR